MGIEFSYPTNPWPDEAGSFPFLTDKDYRVIISAVVMGAMVTANKEHWVGKSELAKKAVDLAEALMDELERKRE